jgi:hypothetical protein
MEAKYPPIADLPKVLTRGAGQVYPRPRERGVEMKSSGGGQYSPEFKFKVVVKSPSGGGEPLVDTLRGFPEP